MGLTVLPAFFACIFVAAGRMDWVRGWICAASMALGMSAIGAIVRKRNPELMRARMAGPAKGTKPFDRVFRRLFIPLLFIQPVVAALDAVRFRWSSMPFATVWPGVILFVAGTALITWGMVSNPYAETSVRIQTDRGHRVVTGGPYRLVRHPMYVGMLAMYTGIEFILGSWWGFVVLGAIVGLLIWRTAMEDAVLLRELPRYADYAARTRWRLAPGIW